MNNHTLTTNSCQEFCLALKTARERKGITLDEIAERTKIPASLFAELERNDLRRWPQGLFRRSFFRDYARLIGVPVTEACAEFVRLFLDGEPAEPATPVETMAEAPSAWQRATAWVSKLVAGLTPPPAPEPTDEPEARPWTSDARRVSHESPKLRVRIRIQR